LKETPGLGKSGTSRMWREISPAVASGTTSFATG